MNLLRQLRDLLPDLAVELRRPLDERWSYLHVTYEHPYVERLWRPHGEGRLFLHRLAMVPADKEPLWHLHPWPCATMIVDGAYEMAVGTGSMTSPTMRSICTTGSGYEMADPWIWHMVRPMTPTWSIMLTGAPFSPPPVGLTKPANPGDRLPLSDPLAEAYRRVWAHLARSQIFRGVS